MKRASKTIAGALFTLAISVGFSTADQGKEVCRGFVPENDMKIPVGWRAPRGMAAGGLSEAQFHAVLDRVEKLFASDIAQAGGVLKVNRLWTDATVNASAQQIGTSWVLNMYGGLARHPEITVEGFALVACHELGHHIGGAPKIQSWFGTTWATNEGGADYYATLKCLRKFFAEDDNATIVANAKIDPFAQEKCEAQFTTTEDQLLCMRGSMAGDSVAGLFMALRKEPKRPRFDTPDPKVVARMDDAHPATQCRMDTYFAGAICDVDASIPVSQTDYREGSCIKGTHETGTRPLCWFKP